MEMSHLFSQFFDFSKIITCTVSIVLIVYGSFRAIKLEPSPKKTVRTIQPSCSRKFTVPIVTTAKEGNGVGAIGASKHKVTNSRSLIKCPTSPACACNTRTCNQRGALVAAAGGIVHSSNTIVEGKRAEASRKETKKHSFSSGRSDDNDDVTVLLLSPGNDVISQNKEFQHSYGQCSNSAKSSRDASPSSTSGSLLSNAAGVQVLDSSQALLLPLGASFSLLFMFFFFDSFQVFFAIAIASVATIAFAFLVHPLCHLILKPFISLHKVSVGVLGRHLPSEILSFVISLTLVVLWLVTGHWLLMDLLSMGLCVSLIAHIRLPSLKVSSILLISLLFYDVFWVFFSSMLFSSNVMVKVATQPAENPVGLLARKLNVASVMSRAPKLSLPGKLIFPSHLSWEELGGDATVFDPSVDSGSGGGALAAANINQQSRHHHHHYHHNIDTNNMIGRVSSASFQPMKIARPAERVNGVAEMIMNKNLAMGEGSDVPSSASFSHLQLMKAVAQQGAISPDGGLRYDAIGNQQGVGFMAPMGAVHMHYSMLGLGDIVIPGLLLCFVLRFDYIRGRSQNIFAKDDHQSKMKESEDENDDRERNCFNWLPMKICSHWCRKITIFHTTLLGYLLGLAVATVSSEVFEKAQPALLYIVPSTLIPLVITALLKGDLQAMWSDPFLSTENFSSEDDDSSTTTSGYSPAGIHLKKRVSVSSDNSNDRNDSYFNSSTARSAFQNSSYSPKMCAKDHGDESSVDLLEGSVSKRGELIDNTRSGTTISGRAILNVNVSSRFWNSLMDDTSMATFHLCHDDHFVAKTGNLPVSFGSGSKTFSPKELINCETQNPKAMSSRSLSETTRGYTAVSMPLAVEVD